MSDAKEIIELYPCVPIDWMWLPKSWRINLGSAYMTLFALSFLSVPISLLLVFPFMWRYLPYFCTGWVAMVFVSMCWPKIEWYVFVAYHLEFTNLVIKSGRPFARMVNYGMSY